MKRRMTLQWLLAFFITTLATSSLSAQMIIEAEDYNYNGGDFIDNPPPSGISSEGFPVNFQQGYFDRSGTQNVDYSDTQQFLGPVSDHYYRPNDLMGTRISDDTLRQKYEDNGLQEIEVFLLQPNEWLNYTRTFSDNDYEIHLRAASEVAQTVRLHLVAGDPSAPNQSTFPIGEFRLTNTNGEFEDFGLVDRNGNPATSPLDGVLTLRLTTVTADNNLRLNYLSLNPASGEAPGPIMIAKSGSEVTVSWSGPGSLQSTTDLDGEWAPVDKLSPAVFTPAQDEVMFFRLIR